MHRLLYGFLKNIFMKDILSGWSRNGAFIYYVRTWGRFKKPQNIKSVYKRMSLYKCPLYDHSWSFFCHMCVYLSQNWGSDGHFEVLNRPYLWLVENLWCKTQIFPFLFFLRFCTKTDICIFFVFYVFVFFVITFVPIKI